MMRSAATMTTNAARLMAGALVISSLLALGCERKPEDLEQWRNAKGGVEKIQEWALSKKESPAVRARAVQMLIEEDQANKATEIIAKTKDEEAKKAMVSAAIETIEAFWAAQDQPVVTDSMKSGEPVKVGGEMKTVRAVEAAYYLHPYAEGAEQKKLEAILAEWLSKDHELRQQLSSRVKLEQLLPRSGPQGFDHIMLWFPTHPNPGTFAASLREYGDEETKKRFAEAIYERAMKEHPNLDKQLQVVVMETDNEAIVPYLERAIDDDKAPGDMVDLMMDAYVRIKGPAATSKLDELVSKRSDVMRSVAFTRLIELRGEAGVTRAANALPLEVEAYPTEGDYTFAKDAPYLCNIIDTELQTTHQVEDEKPVLKKMLTSSRWPAQVIAMECARKNKWADWKPEIEALAGNEQVVPGWSEEGATVGSIAQAIAAEL